jgi:hypothetical protein
MAKITINMVGEQYRLRLKNIGFTTDGTKPEALSKIHIYTSVDGEFDNAYLVSSIDATDETNYNFVFNPGRILLDGPNTFFVIYELNKPTFANAIDCNDPLSFKLVTFLVGDREVIPDKDYLNFVLFAPIERQVTFNTVTISNYDNNNRRLTKEYDVCFTEGEENITLYVVGTTHGGAIAGTYYGYQ